VTPPSLRLIASCALVLGFLAIVPAWPSPSIHALGSAQSYAKPTPRVGSYTTPKPVASGTAHRIRPLAGSASILVTLGLPIRHSAALDRFIAGEASRGRYLTQSEFEARFAPAPSQVLRVQSWARQRDLNVLYTSPGGLAVMVRGSAADVESAFGVRLNVYRQRAHTFFANSTSPTLPRELGIETVLGLDNLNHPVARGVERFDVPANGYIPAQIRNAYDVAGHGIDGTGQTIGLTGYGQRVPNSDFASFTAQIDSSDPRISSCKSCSGPDKIQWFQLGGPNNDTDVSEQALDVEYAHGMAPHSHLKFWLGDDGSEPGLEAAVAAAAADPSLHVVTSSWGYTGINTANDPFVKAINNSLKRAVAVGTTFYFATGDNALDSGCDKPASNCRLSSFPASSPYAVAVGGTNLQMDSSATHWRGETTWSLSSDFSGSGGGCALFFKRPSWQVGVSPTATCRGRAIPDVSAVGDPNTGVQVWANGSAQIVGGTSLSAPVIAGLAVVTDRYLKLAHKPLLGWAAPRIYGLARSSSYEATFHDVLCGTNGYPAGLGWDQATGWGSIDWYTFSKRMAGQSVLSVPEPASWLCSSGSGSHTNLYAVVCTGKYDCHASGASGRVLNTNDGWNWTPPKLPFPRVTVPAMSCPSKSVCFAVGADGRLLESRDGGQHYKVLSLRVKNLTGISCPSGNVCYVTGRSKVVVKITNGKKAVTLKNPATAALTAIKCPTALVCYAVESSGGIIRTTNGTSWTAINVKGLIPGSLSGIACPSTTHCYAVGTAKEAGPLGPLGLIAKTNNGTTWSTQTAVSPLNAVSCANGVICEAVGINGAAIRTVDGQTWVPALASPVSKAVTFTGVACPAKTLCYAVGLGGRLVTTNHTRGH
jgi:kumamolisin